MSVKLKIIPFMQIIFVIFAFNSGVLAEPHIAIRPIVTGLSKPVAITNAGDGSERLFVTLQVGKVVIYNGRQLLSNPFLDVSILVSTGGERGLFSVAFHPIYVNNGLLFLNYTNTDGATVIACYRVSANPDAVDPTSAKILLTVSQPYENHNGGQMQFGPDGFLYIGMGDGGSTGDPSDLAQNPTTLLGMMLRIDL
jgi:glucose/arabinose dehydrogenase